MICKCGPMMRITRNLHVLVKGMLEIYFQIIIQILRVNCYSSKVIMKEFEFKRIKTKNGDNSKVEL
jgi:hypothetical protein